MFTTTHSLDTNNHVRVYSSDDGRAFIEFYSSGERSQIAYCPFCGIRLASTFDVAHLARIVSFGRVITIQVGGHSVVINFNPITGERVTSATLSMHFCCMLHQLSTDNECVKIVWDSEIKDFVLRVEDLVIGPLYHCPMCGTKLVR